MNQPLAIPDCDAVALGGGGGLLEVSWPACRALGLRTVLVETTFGTGGSSGRIRDWLRPTFGETPSPGNLAAALQRVLATRLLDPLLEYRIARDDRRRLTTVVENRLRGDLASASLRPPARELRNRLRALAREWDRAGREQQALHEFHLAGHSVRNLVVLWHWLVRFEVYRGRDRVDEDRMDAALAALHDYFEIDDARVLPVSLEAGTLVARYQAPVTLQSLRRSGLGPSCRGADPHVVVGQHAINLLRHSKMVDFDLCGGPAPGGFGPRPRAFGPVLAALGRCRLILAGAGSFFTSLLACLAVEGVLETMLRRPEVPRVLFINPYHLDQTRGLSVLDLVRFVETLADRVLREAPGHGSHPGVRFEDIFSDIIVADPSGDARLLGLLAQEAGEGEARGPIRLTPQEAERIEARGIRVHCGPYVTPQRKPLKRPGHRSIEIAGYDPLRIATVLAGICERRDGTG